MIRFTLLCIILAVSCSSEIHPPAIRILFIGNSLTYSNDLPALVAELGKQEKIEITYSSIVPGGYSLEDHWNEGRAQKEIENGKYDFVVLQQGPSALPESQVLLQTYAEKFASLCRTKNAKPLLYMVWPSKERSFDHDNVIYSYTQAAIKTESLLAPAGLAWKYAWANDPALPLYSGDNFHPSVTGSVLAALTVYATITNKTEFGFIDFSKCSWKSQMKQSELDKLRAAATKALKK